MLSLPHDDRKTLIMLCQDSKHILHHPSAFGDPVVCSFLFIGELSSAAEFHKFFMASMQRHRHLARNSVNLVHSPHGFRWQKHQDALLDLFPQLAEVKYFMYRTKIHLTRHLPRGCFSWLAGRMFCNTYQNNVSDNVLSLPHDAR